MFMEPMFWSLERYHTTIPHTTVEYYKGDSVTQYTCMSSGALDVINSI